MTPLPIMRLALRSLANRRFTVVLTVVAVALSLSLFLSVTKIRDAAQTSFDKTVSGTDLIVGARTAPINLLLFSVFHMGYPTNSLSWESFDLIRSNDEVDWAIPLSMGDSHRGYRVIGTDETFFDHFRYGNDEPLTLSSGKPFLAATEAVLGATVARELNYALGTSIVIAHGLGEVSFSTHDDNPFVVTGVLAPTGTPVDRAVWIPLEGMKAIHQDFAATAPPSFDSAIRAGQPAQHDPDHHIHQQDEETPAHNHDHDHAHGERHEKGEDRGDAEGRHNEGSEHNHHQDDHGHENHAEGPERNHHENAHTHDGEMHDQGGSDQISAALVGLRSPVATLRLQREINTYEAEPLSAVLPGVQLASLWELMSGLEKTLALIAALVVLIGLLTILTSILTSLQERRREMSVLRAIGARPWHVFALLVSESALLAAAGALLGVVIVQLLLLIAVPMLEARYGLILTGIGFDWLDILTFAVVTIAGALLGILPAWRAYAHSLADGLSIRV